MSISVTITALDQEGRGIARVDGKAVFVEGALIGECVEVDIVRRKPSYDVGRMVGLESPSALRVEPRCPYFGVCGGCSLQHIEAGAQIAIKQRVLEDALWHIGRVHPERIVPPIHGPSWEYRHRARLSVRHVVKKGSVLVGFHERKSRYVADMKSCAVLPERISELLPALRELIAGLSVRDRLPQIELAIGDGGAHGPPVDALALRILQPLTPDDERQLEAFEHRHGVSFYLQTGGPSSVQRLGNRQTDLSYRLPEFDLDFRFQPTDFTQVNTAMNRVLVRRAVALLDPQPGEHIVDFFCGIGNFTLPIARRGAHVVGVEGSKDLVSRAQDNAAANGLAARASFIAANLFAATPESLAPLGALDKVLIDPPRDGAMELVKALPSPAETALKRLVYVSCNPATLARDAGLLVNERGWRLAAAGIANMFPHTAHVESIALFTAPGTGA